MENKLNEIINNIIAFGKHDKDKYVELRDSAKEVPNEIFSIIERYKYEIYVTNPETNIIINFNVFKKDDFSIKYLYLIFFTNYDNYYKSHFLFHVTNFDPDSAGFINEIIYHPITNEQYKLEEELDKALSSIGYIKLSRIDLEEQIQNLDSYYSSFKLKEAARPTVEMLLFNDFFG